MKKYYLLFVCLLSWTLVFSQVNLTLSAPANNGSTSGLRAPTGVATQTTFRGHLLITAAELSSIPTGTSLNGIGFLLSAGASSGTTGNIQIYLENTSDATNLKSTTWSTAISTMTSVYNGTYNIPTTAGPVDLVLPSNFTYTGGGLYVAYDYLGSTFATTGAVYYCNNLLAGGVKVGSSATTTPPATLTATSAFRPEIRLRFPNPFSNNVSVRSIYANHGQENKLLGNTTKFFSRVKNSSNVALTNVPVTLSISGANTFTSTVTLSSLLPGADTLVTFSGVNIPNSGTQSVKVSVPVDQNPIDDSMKVNQYISCNTIGEKYADTVSGGLGYNTGAGIFANLLVLPAGNPIYIKKSIPTIATATAIVGNTIVGVLLDSAGTIIDSTAPYVITTANLGQPVPLTFLGGNTNYAGDTVYYGFRQKANTTTGYFPLGTQNIIGQAPVGVYCGFNEYGGGYTNYTQFGVFTLAVEVSPFLSTYGLSSSPTGTICTGTPVILTATPGLGNYEYFINGGSVQTGTSNTYSFNPTASGQAKVVTNIGSCTFSDSVILNILSSINTNVSKTLCRDETYLFNGNTISTSGTYLDTFTSTQGCDSTITLTVNKISIDTFSNAVLDIMTIHSQAGATYAWYSCDSNKIVSGSTDTVFKGYGNFAAIITINGCSDTTSCYYLQSSSVKQVYGNNNVRLYPNPSKDFVYVEANNIKIENYRLINMYGQTLMTMKDNGTGPLKIEVSNLSPGLYTIELQTDQGMIVKQLIKQ